MHTKRLFLRWLTAFLVFGSVVVTPAMAQMVQVNIAPQHPDWVYKPGETVKFDVSITKNDVLVPNIEISYEFGPEMLPPTTRDKKTLKDGKAVIDAGTMKTSGFLRCRVYAKYEGKNYEGLATAAFSPEAIQPTTTLPDDFLTFWDKAKSELAEVPIDARITLLPERCTGDVNVYHVNLQSYNRSRLYGILCVPKAPGKYPAVLNVPGAGVRPYYGNVGVAARGAVTFEIGIHGIPVTMDQSVYSDMDRSAVNAYWVYNLDNKDRYYYKRVYMGCVRAIDFIFSLPEFDGSNIAVSGGSQGGALSIVTAGLDKRIKGLVSFYPALCDLTGYLNGRAGGWPHMFNDPAHFSPAKIETSKYYDVVNFARQITVPGFYTWGYNDVTCPPTSMYAAYNVINAPRTLYLVEETGHWTYPEQWERSNNWIFDIFKR